MGNRHVGEGSPDDGVLLRLNTHTTWRIRQLVQRWCCDQGVQAFSCQVFDKHVQVRPIWLTRPLRGHGQQCGTLVTPRPDSPLQGIPLPPSDWAKDRVR